MRRRTGLTAVVWLGTSCGSKRRSERCRRCSTRWQTSPAPSSTAHCAPLLLTPSWYGQHLVTAWPANRYPLLLTAYLHKALLYDASSAAYSASAASIPTNATTAAATAAAAAASALAAAAEPSSDPLAADPSSFEAEAGSAGGAEGVALAVVRVLLVALAAALNVRGVDVVGSAAGVLMLLVSLPFAALVLAAAAAPHPHWAKARPTPDDAPEIPRAHLGHTSGLARAHLGHISPGEGARPTEPSRNLLATSRRRSTRTRACGPPGGRLGSPSSASCSGTAAGTTRQAWWRPKCARLAPPSRARCGARSPSGRRCRTAFCCPPLTAVFAGAFALSTTLYVLPLAAALATLDHWEQWAPGTYPLLGASLGGGGLEAALTAASAVSMAGVLFTILCTSSCARRRWRRCAVINQSDVWRKR